MQLLTACTDPETKIHTLHSTIYTLLGKEDSEMLPRQTQEWADRFHTQYSTIFEGHEILHLRSDQETSGRTQMVRSFFRVAAEFKLKMLPTKGTLQFRVQWVGAGANFDSEWMECEKYQEDGPYTHRKAQKSARPRVRLCLFLALLQGLYEDARADTGPAGLAAAIVHAKKFKEGVSTAGFGKQCEDAGIRDVVVVQKAIVLITE